MSILKQQVNSSSNFASFFIVMTHNSLAKIYIQNIYKKLCISFLAETVHDLDKRSLSRYKSCEILRDSRKSKILHFDGLLLSKSCTVSAKKVQKSYLSWHWTVMQSLKKNGRVVSNMTWGIVWIFTQPPKSLKISLRRALFVQNRKVWDKKNTGVLSWH